MRVLHIHSGNLYGGVESILVTLARHRDQCPQMESHFALCFEGRLSDELRDAGGQVYQLGEARIRQPASVWRARRRLQDLLTRFDFDLAIFHSGWSQALFAPVLGRNGLPLVYWFHSATGKPNWLDRWAGRTAPDLALCNSEFTARGVGTRYPGMRTEVVYCPVEDRSLHSASDRVTTRKELNTAEGATVIVQVSRLEAWKGQSLHLSALSLLKDLPNWVCWQVGGPQRPEEARYLEELKAAARQMGILERLRFLGQRSDVPRLLRAADIFCQPNTGPEPFGIAFVEALYAGLPVVTTAIGGAKEIVNESCGRLIPPDDAHALAAALKLLVEDRQLRERMAAAGPAQARQLCDVYSQMRRLQNCFTGILDGERKRTGTNPYATQSA